MFGATRRSIGRAETNMRALLLSLLETDNLVHEAFPYLRRLGLVLGFAYHAHDWLRIRFAKMNPPTKVRCLSLRANRRKSTLELA